MALRFTGISRGHCLALSLHFALLAGCSPDAPECPFTGEPYYGPSAGCLAVIEHRILLVESAAGAMSPPGGKAMEGEPAQCTAHRETWEETGLDLMPGELLAVFDTGFHLYRCEFYRNYDALNVWPSEVRRAFWLPVEDMDKVEWRFAGQGKKLRALIRETDEIHKEE